MWIKESYDDDFEHFMLDMKDKYPKFMFELEGISDDALDMTKFSQRYFLKKNVADASIDANANVQIKSVATYKSEVHKGLDKLNSLYLLWKTAKKAWGGRDANKLLELELSKDLSINDSQNAFLPYCWAFDVYDLLTTGLPFVTNYPSTPAKYSDVFLQHTIQLIQCAANMLMGATAIPNFLVIYSALVKHDSLNPDYPIPNYETDPKMFNRYIEQRFQELVFLLNQPLRNSQSCFTNITIFDSVFLRELCSKYVVHDELIDPDFAMYIQKKFLQTFNKLNSKQLTTFPVLTAQFKKDENGNVEDEEFFEFICNINMEFGHINIFSDTSLNALSSCCRLINNISDILKAASEENTNLIGGSSIKVGSFGVTTINLARIGIKSKGDKDTFLKTLEELAIDAYRINHCRRLLIQNKIEQDQMPLYKYGLIALENQYSTLGINGLYEAIKFMGMDIRVGEGKEFAINILKKLSSIAEDKIKKYGYRCNIEQIPAEATSVRFAKADKLLYNQTDIPLYANQFIPLVDEAELIDRIELQALFEKYFSGGTIMHCNLGTKIESVDVMKKLMTYMIKSGVKYFAINYFFQKCDNGHITIDGSDVCCVCGASIIEKYTRVVGFITPISSWQEERRDEFKQRKKYTNGSIVVWENNQQKCLAV